jgi:pSer/pThr/pTyr-binding forkhead associated (FHA) protein
MEVRLKVLVGKNVGQELLVPGPKFFVGRAEDCQLRPRSDLISRHHCVLLIEDDFVAVRDFGSKNGTLVNDQRIMGERELKSGDKLVIGPLEFQVLIQTTVLTPAVASPAVASPAVASPVVAAASPVLAAAVASPTASKKRPKVESVREAAARTAEGHRSEANGEDGSVDVSQWLTDKDPDGTAETRVINVNETGEIDVSGGITANGSAAEPESVAMPASPPKAPEKRLPGKLPVSAKNGSDDSRSAAADVLNKFFKRR